ncbi:MAG TPA: FAD-dependent oxidoreductase [Planctomycetota bacterium]|nr:FAD-dependent oxidoreductase [Planctomycetota bacterium]HRR80017.1 FAD-dependent oxidoreductase [Planctomycetota bacterium]
MKRKVVIIGGVAAGPKTAARLRRLDPEADITIVEKGHFISYAGCSLPYYVGGVVREQKELTATPAGAARDPAYFHKLLNVRVLTHTEATRVDRAAKRVEIRDAEGTRWLDYDVLVLATGAKPLLPKLPGVELPNVFTLHRIEDAEGIKTALAGGRGEAREGEPHYFEHPAPHRHAVIIGGGLIGVEAAEAAAQCGCRATIIEMLPQILPMLDWELARLVEQHLAAKGVRVLTGATAKAIEGRERAEAVVVGDERILADAVIAAVGVRPNSDLAREAGLQTGPTGGIVVDAAMRTADPSIYAVGDCTEDRHLISGRPMFLSNGASANKKGRVAANAIAGRPDQFPGIVGSAVCKAFDFTAARTGLGERQARELGFDAETCLVPAPDRVHHYPGAKLVVLKLIADRRTRKLLGAQAVGAGEAAKRIDVAATALVAGMTVDQVANLDLCYAPPYSAPLDNIIAAANALRNKLDGLMHGLSPMAVKAKLDAGEDFLFLDVRTPPEFDKVRLPGAMHIPLGALRDKLGELPRGREIVAFCAVSLRAYSAERMLRAAGFTKVAVMEGGVAAWPYEKIAQKA